MASAGAEAADAALAGTTTRLRFGIALFDGVEELDWAGPWEVLTAWARWFPDDDVEVFTMSPDGGPVRCAKGARVLADHSWNEHPPVDVLLYPGGEGTRSQLGDVDVREVQKIIEYYPDPPT